MAVWGSLLVLVFEQCSHIEKRQQYLREKIIYFGSELGNSHVFKPLIHLEAQTSFSGAAWPVSEHEWI